ncbi:cobyric acid synthase CobQ [Bacillus sp. V3-13]|uniref:cobyric acid synthase n=1 Tax=Bacillus sp. V3-13 TaxID=2053728 RepID=UPI000C76749C|nr:cobyric acid synthase [Bacillus sp. V3-13]PLR77320.1 cobyric acid synthase CobQ [Bacillus sp. V3-13]
MNGIMFQGTASDVGKSLIVTAICRLLAREGHRVAPFKSQNMSNNSYVTADGKEIGRAQGLQAEAAGTEAAVWMNPILLKPRSDQQAEVVLLGEVLQTLSGKDYRDTFYEKGIATVKEALSRLEKDYELIIMEGAGSPVEVNLKDKELVNMKVAELADVPVILISDIDRGGVFASIIGTLALLSPRERSRVKGIIINKFRGDIALFKDGVSWIEEQTGLPVLGVLPYLDQHMIEGEDSLSLADRFSLQGKVGLDIAVIRLPYLSNYSDIEPFLYEEDVAIRWVDNNTSFGRPDAVIIPGTKSTINDLTYLRKQGLDQLLIKYLQDGGTMIGLCGGYQMLSRTLIDAEGSDTGTPGQTVSGLSIIPAVTTFYEKKITVRASGTLYEKRDISVEGYEIHLGKTLPDSGKSYNPFLLLENDREEGISGLNGRIIGTYLHHLFHNDEWRSEWLNTLRSRKGMQTRKPVMLKTLKEQKYDELANRFAPHLDWQKLKEMMVGSGSPC